MPSKIVRCQKSALAFEKVRSHQFFNWCVFCFLQDLQDLQGAGTWRTCRELGAGSWEQGAGSCPQQGRSYKELQVGRLDSGNNTDLGTSVTILHDQVVKY